MWVAGKTVRSVNTCRTKHFSGEVSATIRRYINVLITLIAYLLLGLIVHIWWQDRVQANRSTVPQCYRHTDTTDNDCMGLDF